MAWVKLQIAQKGPFRKAIIKKSGLSHLMLYDFRVLKDLFDPNSSSTHDKLAQKEKAERDAQDIETLNCKFVLNFW